MDNHLPNLVNLNEDPQLSEILLYMIKEGTTTVGKNRPSSSHDIQLSGVLIADDHWCVPPAPAHLQLPPHASAFVLRPGVTQRVSVSQESRQLAFCEDGRAAALLWEVMNE